MENPHGDSVASPDEKPDAWFTLKVAVGALALYCVLDEWSVIMFFAGWWWGVRNLSDLGEKG